jgi:hypothetical protein
LFTKRVLSRCLIRENIHVATLGAPILSSYPFFLLDSATLAVYLAFTEKCIHIRAFVAWGKLGMIYPSLSFFLASKRSVLCFGRHWSGTDGMGNSYGRIRSSCNNNTDIYSVQISAFESSLQLLDLCINDFARICIMMIDD